MPCAARRKFSWRPAACIASSSTTSTTALTRGRSLCGPCLAVDEAAEALEVAAKADVVVMCLGLTPYVEGEEMPVKVEGFVGGDRTDIALPKAQQALLERVHALGKPVVLVLLGGSAIAVTWADAHVPAILQAWYPGEAGGTALAEVLFGDTNPSGRLPVTVYKSVADLPAVQRLRDGEPHLPLLPGRAALPLRPRAELHDVRL